MMKAIPRYKLIGRKSGRLVVVDVVESNNSDSNRRLLVCLCECGGKKTLPVFSFKSYKSCGCIRKSWDDEYRKSICGMRSGLLVITDASQASNSNKFLVECACDCGTLGVKRSFHSLAKGASDGQMQSCGCFNGILAGISNRASHGEVGSTEYTTWAGYIHRTLGIGFDEFLIRYGRRPSKDHVFSIGVGWERKSISARIARVGYVNHIYAFAAYIYAARQRNSVASMTGFSESKVKQLPREFPEAYAMGLQRKREREQAERNAAKPKPRKLNASVDF